MLGSVLASGRGEAVLDKLLDLIVGAKSGALSGVLIVAGALVTVSSGNGVTTATGEHPAPSVEASAEPELPRVWDIDDAEPPEPVAEAARDEDPRAAERAPSSCAESASSEARAQVQTAFARYHAALQQLRREHTSSRAAETLTKADAMLREIAEKADGLLSEMGGCEGQVGERAAAAMETVYNLAKSAATAAPTPKPAEKAKPKPTAKPKATPKPSRTPSCDDRIHDNKLKCGGRGGRPERR